MVPRVRNRARRAKRVVEQKIWRGEDERFTLQNEYRRNNELFTLRIHGKGEFKKFRGRRVYVGGWVRMVDGCCSDYLSMLLISDICGRVGLKGLSYYYYKKPMSDLDSGVVHLKTVVDCLNMARWVLGVRTINLYVTHPNKKTVHMMILGELNRELRVMWPKCVLAEISEVEARLIEGVVLPQLEWRPMEMEPNVEIEEMEA